MQVLKISNELNEKLSNDEKIIKTLLIYGFKNKDEFMNYIIEKLNNSYSFLKITSYDTYDKSLNSLYHMYNGYVDGEIEGFDEVTISFTTMKDGKVGNVFLNQQLVPMMLSKLEKDGNFLNNPRIKKICLLTTHISKKNSPKNNIIRFEKDNALQMTLNIAKTVGFDLIDIFRIQNTNINQSYKSVDELLSHISTVQGLKNINSKHQQILYDEINDKYVISFDNKKIPEGQTMKFLSFKLFALSKLLKGNKMDLSLAMSQSKDRSLVLIENYNKLLQKNINEIIQTNLDIIDNQNNNVVESIEEDFIEIEEDIDTTNIEEHKRTPIFKFNKLGKKTAVRNSKIIANSIKKNDYNCALHDNEHQYFISATTNKNYLEGHHLIPMEQQLEYWEDIKVNLDCVKNVIPLCPHCHSKVHHGNKHTKYVTLTKLFSQNQSELNLIDPNLTLDKLLSFYNVFIL